MTALASECVDIVPVDIELLIIILLASLILAIPMIAGALANGPAFIPSR